MVSRRAGSRLNSQQNNCITAIQAIEASADEALMLDPRSFVATIPPTSSSCARAKCGRSSGDYCWASPAAALLPDLLRAGIAMASKNFQPDAGLFPGRFTCGTFAGLASAVRSTNAPSDGILQPE